MLHFVTMIYLTDVISCYAMIFNPFGMRIMKRSISRNPMVDATVLTVGRIAGFWHSFAVRLT